MGRVKTRTRVETDLPEDIRDDLNRLLLENATYDEITDWCREQGFDISRSSIGRYGKRFLESYRLIKQTEDQARALTSEVGDGLRMEEATSKLLVQQIMSALVADPGDILEHHRIIQAFAALQGSSVRREKAKAEFADRVRKAAENVEKIAVKGGLSADVVGKLRKEILGVVE